MPQYLSPGVYIEEKNAGPVPIEGVSTSVTGAVGVTARGPTDGKPVLVTSFAEFVRTFGDFLPEPSPSLLNQWALSSDDGGRWWDFPLSVKGYFDNGGKQLYVKRVFANSAVSASKTLGQGIIAEIVKDEPATSQTLKLRTLIGIENGATLPLFNGPATLVGNVTVSSYDASTGIVRLSAAIGTAVKAGLSYLVVEAFQAPAAPANETLKFTAAASGVWGNDLQVRVRPVVGATFNILQDPAIGGATFIASVSVQPATAATTVTVDSTAGFTATDRVLINGREYGITVASATTFTLAAPGVPGTETWTTGTKVKRLRRANNSAALSNTLHVWGASQLYKGAIVEIDNGTVKDVTTVAGVSGEVVTFDDNLTRQFYEGEQLRVVEAEVAVQYLPGGVVAATEVFSPVRLVNDNSPSYLVNNVNALSKLVRAERRTGFSESDLAAFPAVTTIPWDTLENGDDNLAALKSDDFVGVDGGSGKRTGIQALEDIPDISIVLAPGIWAADVQSAMIVHCETLKYRFAILDPKDDLSIDGIQSFRSPLDTKYAALYYPWLEVRDPSVSRNVICPPSGHVAGVYARVDDDRGVWKAPANEVIQGIFKIDQDVTKREQDLLNPKGINALRFFPGRGNRIWGARTLSSDASWKYINVRRLFIFIEASIDAGTQFVVFEPNDEPLWARVRATIGNFLGTQWRNGALQGATAAEAYFVKCDRTTMSQDDIDNGRLICLIGIAPVKPAEFVIFQIQQKTLDQKAP